MLRLPGQGDGLVHALPHGLGEGEHDGHLQRRDHGHVVAGLLGHLLAVLVAVGVVAVACTSHVYCHVTRVSDCHVSHTQLISSGMMRSLGARPGITPTPGWDSIDTKVCM